MAEGSEPPLVGVLAIEVGGEGGRHDAFIHEIARAPGLHAGERGVGTALLRGGMAAARGGQGRKVGVVQLLVDTGNIDAIAWCRARGFRVVTAYTEECGTMRESEVPGAQAMYLPEWQLGRRRGMPRRPKQLCMQADGATLMQSLQASRGAKQASRTRVYELGEASDLRGGAAWATVTALWWTRRTTRRAVPHTEDREGGPRTCCRAAKERAGPSTCWRTRGRGCVDRALAQTPAPTPPPGPTPHLTLAHVKATTPALAPIIATAPAPGLAPARPPGAPAARQAPPDRGRAPRAHPLRRRRADRGVARGARPGERAGDGERDGGGDGGGGSR